MERGARSAEGGLVRMISFSAGHCKVLIINMMSKLSFLEWG